MHQKVEENLLLRSRIVWSLLVSSSFLSLCLSLLICHPVLLKSDNCFFDGNVEVVLYVVYDMLYRCVMQTREDQELKEWLECIQNFISIWPYLENDCAAHTLFVGLMGTLIWLLMVFNHYVVLLEVW